MSELNGTTRLLKELSIRAWAVLNNPRKRVNLMGEVIKGKSNYVVIDDMRFLRSKYSMTVLLIRYGGGSIERTIVAYEEGYTGTPLRFAPSIVQKVVDKLRKIQVLEDLSNV